MSTAGGPRLSTDGLVLAIDAANTRGISPAANEEFNNSDQFIKNMVDSSYTITANNGVKIGNLNYYTAFAIDYPETSFGGVAAGRDGITAGFNVTSGTKTHEYGRALHFHIWDDSAGGWISNSNFNGDGSFRYDTWGGYANASTQVAQFVTDYNNLKVIYPNDTFIVAGSHRDSTHTTDKINVLLDLGAPSNVSSLLDGSPEWILVGKPGLGAGNAYVWSFENYSINADRVAHAVFPLPINKVNKDNYFEFDNTDDYIQLPNDLGYSSDAVSVFCWYRINGNPAGNYHILCGGQELELSINVSHSYIRNGLYTTSGRFVQNDGNVSLNDGNWHFYGFTYDGSTKRAYIDGVQVGTQAITGTLTTSFGNRRLGRFGGDTSYYANGRMAKYEVWNRALPASEVLQNYNATKGRFGL